MGDTLYNDVSEFNPAVNSQYTRRFLAFRSNDGTYRDDHFHANLGFAKHACDSGKWDGFIVYFVFEENWRDTVQTFIDQVGKPHPRMAVMVDVENWQDKITGDHSAEINECRKFLIRWLRKNFGLTRRRTAKRVVGYANASDFASLWPKRGNTSVVLANYDDNPSFPNKIAHQFADDYDSPPFGKCDINSADGLTPSQFAVALGLAGAPVNKKPKAPKPPKKPAPADKPVKPKPAPKPCTAYRVQPGDTFTSIAAENHVSLGALIDANPQIKNPSEIFPDQIVYIP